jgi:hypothetical protein
MVNDKPNRYLADANPTMLTKIQAEALVLTRLRARCDCAHLSIADYGTEERPFGWMFLLSVGETGSNGDQAGKIPRVVIVNQHSLQVIASFIDRGPAQFISVYEKLLSRNQSGSDNWCMTMSFPFPWPRWRQRSVADLAKDAGFYEIRGEENQP